MLHARNVAVNDRYDDNSVVSTAGSLRANFTKALWNALILHQSL